MRTIIISAFLCLSSLTLFAQKNILGVSYQPAFASSIIRDLLFTSEPPLGIRYSGRFSHSFGMDFIRLTKEKKFGLRSGIYWVDSGFKETHDYYGYKNGNLVILMAQTDVYYLKSINVSAQFHASTKGFYASIGPNIDYIFSAKIVKGNDERTELNYSPKYLVLGIALETGYNFKLTEAMSLKTALMGRLSPWGFQRAHYGLSVGIIYNYTKKPT